MANPLEFLKESGTAAAPLPGAGSVSTKPTANQPAWTPYNVTCVGILLIAVFWLGYLLANIGLGEYQLDRAKAEQQKMQETMKRF